MKRAEIVVDVCGDRVTIVELRNIRRFGELPKDYLGGMPIFYLTSKDVVELVVSGCELVLCVGQTCSSEFFEAFTQQMRLAGDRLTAINKAAKQPKRVVVKI